MSEKTAAYRNWLVLAISMPLFSVSFFRINVEIFHIPIPAVVIAIVFILTMLRGHSLKTDLQGLAPYRALFICTILIFLTHGMSVFQSPLFENALREFSKISFGIASFWLIILFFPNDPQFLKRFFKYTAGATFILLSVLLYHYGFHLKAPYLGTFYEEGISPNGKSHLAWFITLLAPYCLHALFEKHISPFWIAVNTLIGLSIIYAMSRASWIAMLFTIFFLGFFTVRDRLRPNLKMVTLIVLGIALALGLLMYHSDQAETLAMRIQSVYNPNSLPNTPKTILLGKYSRENRSMLISNAFSKFKKNPLVGLGLGASAMNDHGVPDSEMVTHNDYLSLLAETGLMGTVPFFIFLTFLAQQLLRSNKNQPSFFFSRAAQASFISMLILSNFINSYTSVHYWVFLALTLKVKKISQLQG